MVLTPTLRDPWGRVVGEDRGEVLAIIAPDPDDFSQRSDIGIQANGPLGRPVFNFDYANGNRLLSDSPIIDDQKWLYNDEFDIPTLYTDENQVTVLQDVDSSLGKVSAVRSGYFGFTNLVSSLDVNADGVISGMDVLQIVNFINGEHELPEYRQENKFRDVTPDGVIDNKDVTPINDFLNDPDNDPDVPVYTPDTTQTQFDFTSVAGMSGVMQRVTTLTGRTEDSIVEYEYYDTPGVAKTHGMIHKIIEAPGTSIEAVTTLRYDDRANVNEVEDPSGRITRYFYDDLDRNTAIVFTDPDGSGPLISAMQRFDYDVFGNVIATELLNSSIDDVGNVIYTSLVDGNAFDGFNRLTGTYLQDPDTTWYVTSVGAIGVTRSTTAGSAPSSLDLVALASANPPISTSSAANSAVTPATDASHRGLTTEYTYDDNHNLLAIAISDAGADIRTSYFTYDEVNRPVFVESPNPGASAAVVAGETRGPNGGYVTSTIFDNNGAVWQTTDTQGLVTDIRYDALGRPISVAVPHPSGDTLVATSEYKKIHGVGLEISQTVSHEIDGNLATDPSVSTSVQFDFRGNVAHAKDAHALVSEYSYYSDGLLKSVYAPGQSEAIQTLDYDSRGRLTESLDALQNATTYSYFSDGLLDSVTDALGRATTYSYDLGGRNTGIAAPDPDGAGTLLPSTITYDLDSIGNVVATQNGLLHESRVTYDSRFRTLSTEDPDGKETHFAYDVFGNLEQVTDANSNVTKFQYDNLNRQYAEEKVGYGSRTSAIDGVGNVHEYTDRNGRVTRFEYDDLYRLTKEIWEDSGTDIREFAYSYDFLGNVVSITDTDAATAADLSDTLEFSYDKYSRLGEVLVDNPLLADTVGFAYQYDARGLLDATTANQGAALAAGSLTGGTDLYENAYSYDVRGLLTQIEQDGLVDVHDKMAAFEYNAAGQLTDLRRYNALADSSPTPKVHSSYGYDDAGRLQSLTHGTSELASGAMWDGTSNANYAAAYFYEYDVADRLTSMSSFADATEASYSYDARDQLTGVAYARISGISGQFYDEFGSQEHLPLPTAEDYSFDGTGNRELTPGTSSSATGTHNRVQSDGSYTYTYDAEGNLLTKVSGSDTTTFEYDHRNRLVKVSTASKVVTYQYDALDQRTGKQVDEGANGSVDRSEAWIWNGGHAVLRFEDADGDGSQPFELASHYLYGAAVDMLLAEDVIDSGSGPGTTQQQPGVAVDGILWPLSDHLGSVRDLVDSEGVRREHRVYDSFGNVTREEDYDAFYGWSIDSTHADAVDSAIGYTGREWDEDIDLQYNRARWYDPAQGRWISQDPIGFNAGDANLYRYVGNHPTMATDPSGLAGVGHHWITLSKLLRRAGEFEEDALYVLLGAYSGALETAHNRRAMDGISHTQYDRAVERALDDFLDNRGMFSGKVSASEAKEFAQCLYEGSVFDGPDAEKLRRFNAQVIRELRSGEKFVEPSKDSIEDLIKRGRSYAKTERGRAVLRAAKLIAILGTVFSSLATAAEATETIGNSSALRQALQNINKGDFTAAERNLAGANAGSLLSELRSKGLISPYVEPLLEKELRGIPGRIKEWEESFCE